MSTRFYLPYGGTTAPISPSVYGSGGVTPAVVRRNMATTKAQNTPLTARNVSDGVYNGWGSPAFQCNTLFVSPPLAAQTISGTFSAVIKCRCGQAYVGSLAFRIVVYSSTGVQRYIAAAPSTQVLSTTAQTLIASAESLSSQAACFDGDYLTVAICANVVDDTDPITTFYYGDPTATADYPLTSGLTTNLCPWVEFSQDLIFKGGAPIIPGPGWGQLAL